MDRRDLLKGLAIGAVVASTPITLQAKTNTQKINQSSKTRVVVCGGGFGGLTTAKYLKQFNPDLEVVVIEKNTHFLSCPYSNLWLGEVDNVSLADLSFDYLSASTNFGYEFVNETIVDIDRKKQLILTSGETYKYDYLVIASGIEYDYSKLFKDTQKAKDVYRFYLPAMKSGSEHLLLKKKIENFKGGNFIINVPSGAYRCPPAPYERACMIAYYFKKNNIKAKVIILDPREKPAAKPKGFLHTFKTLYKDYIEYIPRAEIRDINLEQKSLSVDIFDFITVDYVPKEISFEDANIIPSMKPSELVNKANLSLNKKGWTKLKAPTFESVDDDKIIVIGDSGGHPYPKSGHMANSGGYVAAKALAFKTLGKPFDISKELPSNICYSMVNGKPLEGISVHHSVSFNGKKLKVKAKSTAIRDGATGESISSWYKGITTDMFGEV
jgi:NADH dehydrogenase FAD-containing subunit